MPEEKKEQPKVENKLEIKFEKILNLNRKGETIFQRDPLGGEVKDNKGKPIPTYARDDCFALRDMLGAVDTTKFDWDILKTISKLQDKLKKHWQEDAKSIVLTVDEAGFLKGFLKDLDKKKLPRAEFTGFHLTTRVSIVEQLGGK